MLRKSLTGLIKLLAVALGLVGLLYVSGFLLSPTLEEEAILYDEAVLEEITALRDLSRGFDDPPTFQVEVDYREGESAAWWPRGESPILAELVAEGKLPPVEERVGYEPLVMQGVEGIGNYGGTWFRVANSAADVVTGLNRLSGTTLVRWSPLGYPIRPNIAKGWEVSEDRREWTFFLREGMRWSDGHPFTADDLVYWWRWDRNYFTVQPLPQMVVGGESGDIIKVDDYTVKFVFPHPYGNFLEILASNFTPFAPRHYLEPYHPEIGDQELIRRTMAAHNLSSKRTLYFRMTNARNPEHPRLWPWIYRTHRSSPPESFVRNPYYWAVDTEGNQLPYIDRILIDVKSASLIPIVAAAGDLSMQARHIRYEDYTLLMENRERNNYDVYHWFSGVRSVWMLWPNQNRRVDEGDPVSAWKARFLKEKRFRQALSLAVDRKKIIRALYNNYGEPAQNAPGRESPFHHEGLLKNFTEYDPARANALLDEIGLTRRDSEGMRAFPDGTRMTWFIDFTSFTGEGPSQFVVDDWARVGVRAIHRERTRPLFVMERNAFQHDFMVWSGESEFNPMVDPRSFVAYRLESAFAPAYGHWHRTGGPYGMETPAGVSEPDPDGPIRRGQILWEKAVAATTLEEQITIFDEILEIASEEVISISIATPPPQLAVVKKGFRNVPQNVLFAYAYATPANSAIETYFFDDPQDSPGAVAQIKREMTTATPAREVTASLEGGTSMGRLIWNLFLGILVACIVMAGMKHPYIGRRLLIMIPTLSVISFVVFFIIQMPPGDYIETRILQLQLTGDEAAIEEVERLREDFHLDKPFWHRYIIWVGLPWFVTFDSADKGLLQGDMGRTMETSRPVNAVVGDRVLLTFLVSLGTMLFTWAIAVPIGIYSAVRQYTVGDYILSFIGFIGMCIPNFLLAIIMMYLSSEYLGINVTGLFSPEYAAMPEWSWGKIMDLMAHIWVPIVIIATGGTAGMIRVMRGNLLDELGKPYVTTARAKGVRPFKLLMKYPVRMALNPFISGMGSIFPQLVSGGAIVAIVLSLPMVGPVLLEGLMTQDIYLAGSMLMVLSLLGVFGTLVSDLMLLWLDPRIRMEGGTR